MSELLVRDAAVLYGCAYFGSIAILAVWERLAPRRALLAPPGARWLRHLVLAVLDPALVRLVLPVLAISMAVVAAEREIGLFHHVDAPGWLAAVVSLLALDLARYAQHRLMHRVPVLWRLHRMHHTDVDYDFSTALRFHPLESLLGALVGVGVVAALGAPVAAVVANEVLFVAASLFVHGNVRVPRALDRALRVLLVTPDMHCTHHSVREREMQSNYGGLLSFWDRAFGSYVAEPAGGPEGVTIGLPQFREPEHQRLLWMLLNPVLPEPGAGGR